MGLLEFNSMAVVGEAPAVSSKGGDSSRPNIDHFDVGIVGVSLGFAFRLFEIISEYPELANRAGLQNI